MNDLFIALRTKYYRQFERGEKTHEWRLYGAKWNETSCKVGRGVTLSLGYNNRERLKARISSFQLYVRPPSEVLQDLIDCFGPNVANQRVVKIGIDVLCEECNHPRIHHFDDGKGSIACRSTQSCKCQKAVANG